MNAIVIAVSLMLGLSLLRVNVVIALSISALIGGLVGNLSLTETIIAFESGLGGGATTALSYAMLGTLAVAISRSGITDLLAQSVIKRLDSTSQHISINTVKYTAYTLLLILAISSQNIIPIHIAFIPLVIPPLLHVFAKLELDRRVIACILTFGLVTPYMIIPIGFGGIFLENILLPNLKENGLTIEIQQVPEAIILPVTGMVIGLLIAVFFSYKAPRIYAEERILKVEPQAIKLNMAHIYVTIVAILAGLATQLYSGSMIVGGLIGFSVFTVFGVIKWHESHDVFSKGIQMMAMIGFIMIAAAGFAAVMKATGGVEELVNSLRLIIGDSKSLAAILMLFVGLFVTLGIGSSFSTVPILATIYVPLCISFGFSPLATVALVGTAAALGDAGSPASDSTLGPTSGLNADGQHDHIWDSVVPTFIHYNLPLILFGWVAAVVL